MSIFKYAIVIDYFSACVLLLELEVLVSVSLISNPMSLNFGTIVPFPVTTCHSGPYIFFHFPSRNKDALTDPPFHKSYLGFAYLSKNCVNLVFRCFIISEYFGSL